MVKSNINETENKSIIKKNISPKSASLKRSIKQTFS